MYVCIKESKPCDCDLKLRMKIETRGKNLTGQLCSNDKCHYEGK